MELLRVAALGFRLAGILVCGKGARVVCAVDAAATARVGLYLIASRTLTELQLSVRHYLPLL